MLKIATKRDWWNNYDPNDYQEIIQKLEIVEGIKQTNCNPKRRLSLFARQVSFLGTKSKLHLFNWLEAEINESNEPPNDAPNDKEVVLIHPCNAVQIFHLYVPNFGGRCAYNISLKTLAHELCYCDVINVKDQAVGKECIYKCFFWYQRVKLYKEKS